MAKEVEFRIENKKRTINNCMLYDINTPYKLKFNDHFFFCEVRLLIDNVLL